MLVDSHEWTQKMVATGEHGVRAPRAESMDEVVDRLTVTPTVDYGIAV